MTAAEHNSPEDRADALLAVVANVAAQMGFDPDRIIADLTGPTELGRFCSSLLDLPSLDLPTKRRGAPPDDRENLFLVRTIELDRREGKTLEAAADDFVKRINIEREKQKKKGLDRDSVIRRYRRIRKRWPHLPAFAHLADLFVDPSKT